MDTPFIGIDYSSVVIADVNGDKYPDILLSGDTGLFMTSKGPIRDYARVTKLYINDGLGQFKEVKDTPFVGVSYSSVAIADVNGDQYPDVLISGYDGSARITRLYLHNGK